MASDPSRSASIYIVDDDEAIRDALCTVLDDEGYTTASAADGAAALAWLEVNPSPGVILLDLQMPVMDGFEFRARQRIHPRLSAIPVIVCTAGGADDARIRALDSALVMKKPFDLQQMFLAIATLLPA